MGRGSEKVIGTVVAFNLIIDVDLSFLAKGT